MVGDWRGSKRGDRNQKDYVCYVVNYFLISYSYPKVEVPNETTKETSPNKKTHKSNKVAADDLAIANRTSTTKRNVIILAQSIEGCLLFQE